MRAQAKQPSLLEQLVDAIEVPPAPPGYEHEAERFWEKVEIRGDLECWPWMAVRLPRGYGVFSRKERKVYSHRWIFEAFWGEIGADLTIDHLVCDHPACCNPLHLIRATQRANNMRGTSPAALNARKTECSKGHPFTPENTRRGAGGDRACRQCDRERKREQRANKGGRS